jgi:type IV pilus assembly protein PilA
MEKEQTSEVKPRTPLRRRIIRGALWVLGGLAALLVLAAIFIPTLDGPNSRKYANEAATVGRLRSLNIWEQRYTVRNPKEGYTCQFADLASEIRDDDSNGKDALTHLAQGRFVGYHFEILNCAPNQGRAAGSYQITAVPVAIGVTGFRAFCTDQSGVIRYEKNGTAQACLRQGQPLQ